MKNTQWLNLLVICVITFLLLLPGLRFGFVNLDDNFYVTDNVHIRHISIPNIKYFLTSFHHGVYAPIQYITYMLIYSVVNYHAWLYHLVNILFYILSGVLVYLLIQKIQKDSTVALLSTLWFLLSPVNIDTAVWIAELKNSQSLLFFLMSFYFYVMFRQALDGNHNNTESHSKPVKEKPIENVKPGHKSLTFNYRAWYILSLVSFFAGLLVKPPGATILLMMLIYDLLINKKNLKEGLIKLLPFFLLLIPFMIVYMIGQSTIGSYHGLIRGSVLAQIKAITTVIAGVFNYPVRLIIPVNLSVAYPIDAKISNTAFVLSLVIIGLMIIGIKKLFKNRNKLILFWISWYFVNMLPYYGIIAMPFFADWYLYIPSIGLYTAFVGSVVRIENKKWALGLLCFIIFSFGVTGFQRQFVWKNDINMWKSSMKAVGGDTYIVRNLAVSYFKSGDVIDGIRYGNELLKNTPDFVMMKYLIGKGYAELHEYDRAQKVLNNAIQQLQNLNEKGLGNTAVMPGLGDTPEQLMSMLYAELGDIHLSLGDFNRAIDMYKKAISIFPLVHAYDMLAFVYVKLHNIDEAIDTLQKIVIKKPDESEPWRMLGYIMAEYSNDKKLAVKYFEKSLEIEPDQKYAAEMRHFIKIWKTNNQ
ncbi:MAG: tetratricopeptide repeat protein [bacterium]